MKIKRVCVLTFIIMLALSGKGMSYPPAVGILGKAASCMSCHANNGPWTDERQTIIDVLDKDTMKSLGQADGTFLVTVKRGEPKTLLTVIGRTKGDTAEAPYRNAWLYLDASTIGGSSLSKFAPGWDVNLPMSCRIVGDKLEQYEGAALTVLPMTIRPTDVARDAELTLQVMLTQGESVKGKPKEGMLGSYFERKVKMKVTDE
ncbi:MAG: hypothetical protein A3G33_04100 [Omnitrophica bacterium RIFCSPLOWO2_12_FULL_44_17]|uniref:Cytochrome c domain-containing protein n=1 Tax=Candidatus Danuiimicrobium aquiferis TaxID=1801832 RepID=A0A1G1KZF2_9BACT|nr:MAG: hypothetical protein A3B72_10305 [Omnitrophica bacterium RIFCSPHIGHO2_02_FULL_45_28]OGW98278.1 MAG: hypothetical protein A3G33_04100 [Omnitrophica bacterium RIFCSPLOWO2_12_FULL_44_17]